MWGHAVYPFVWSPVKVLNGVAIKATGSIIFSPLYARLLWYTRMEQLQVSVFLCCHFERNDWKEVAIFEHSYKLCMCMNRLQNIVARMV